MPNARFASRRTLRSLGRRAGELDGSRLQLLAVTFCALLTARVLLRLLPSHRILACKARPVTPRVMPPDAALEAGALVRWAVLVVSRRSPVRFVCFPQCVAGAWLLRQRGIDSRLHFGIRREEGRLVTHTWLESGGMVLLGAEAMEGFSTLGVY